MRMRHWIALAVAMAVLFLATTAPWAQAGTQKEQTAAKPVPAPIPDTDRIRPNPRPATPASIASGRQTFSSQCTMCHGASGDGTGDLVSRLKLEMPDFTDRSLQKTRTDGELFYILTHGRGRMQGEGDRLSDEMKWDIVNFLRSLGSDI